MKFPATRAIHIPTLSANRRDYYRSPFVALTTLVVIALVARLAFFDYQSEDYVDFYWRWYTLIEADGGFSALRHNFSSYNVPYLYLLATTVQLHIPALVAVKLIAVTFDILLGWFVFRIICLRYSSGPVPLVGALVVVLLPTIVLNSSMWGQCDSAYASFAIGGLYFVLRHQNWTACTLFGVALAFKLQAVFVFPVLLLMVLGRRLPWQCLLAIPGIYLLLDVPALLLGAQPGDLLTVYIDQASLLNEAFITTAPNAFQYLDAEASKTIQNAGIALTGVLTLGLAAVAALRRVELTERRIMLAAVVSVLLVPFFLPNMHERYFYLADVLTVVVAFWLPRRFWYVPVLTQFASLFAYMPSLLLPYRIRDLTGNPDVAGESGFNEPSNGSGWLASTLRQASDPMAVMRHLFEPVISYQVLTTAVLAALMVTLVIAVREFRQIAPQRV